jgi:hypothetical protein
MSENASRRWLPAELGERARVLHARLDEFRGRL